mgnify:CR=1 FL=1
MKRLRTRKHRERKPFALMPSGLHAARRLAVARRRGRVQQLVGLRPRAVRDGRRRAAGEPRVLVRARVVLAAAARAGGFEPLRFVPKGKKVVLGLVTSKSAEMESKDMLKGPAVIYNAELRGTSSWANTFLGRDHFHAGVSDEKKPEPTSSNPPRT